MPKPDATRQEQLVRQFNYPVTSAMWDMSQVPVKGIKAFFLSDVCAAYRRSAYKAIGGFEHPLRTNEDMFFAAQALQKGYSVAYAGDAAVLHSHNFTLRQQYQRNRLQGYEIARHHSLLQDVSRSSEGAGMVKAVAVSLLREGRFLSFVRFGLDCVARLLGSKTGEAEWRKANPHR